MQSQIIFLPFLPFLGHFQVIWVKNNPFLRLPVLITIFKEKRFWILARKSGQRTKKKYAATQNGKGTFSIDDNSKLRSKKIVYELKQSTIIFSRSSLNCRNVFGLRKVVFAVEDRPKNPGSHLSPMIAFEFLTFNTFIEFKDPRWYPRSSLGSKIKDCNLDLESQVRLLTPKFSTTTIVLNDFGI